MLDWWHWWPEAVPFDGPFLSFEFKPALCWVTEIQRCKEQSLLLSLCLKECIWMYAWLESLLTCIVMTWGYCLAPSVLPWTFQIPWSVFHCECNPAFHVTSHFTRRECIFSSDHRTIVSLRSCFLPQAQEVTVDHWPGQRRPTLN